MDKVVEFSKRAEKLVTERQILGVSHVDLSIGGMIRRNEREHWPTTGPMRASVIRNMSALC